MTKGVLCAGIVVADHVSSPISRANFQRDTAIPKHRTRWNWTYDLPVGKGKLLARNAPNWVNNLLQRAASSTDKGDSPARGTTGTDEECIGRWEAP
jgi:hypothetical protein